MNVSSEAVLQPKYRLVSRLAAGGMGEVFLARQEGPAGFVKMVVVKRILDHLATDESFVQMFLDEARLAALLSHPNVVQIFELGTQGQSYFIAMEFIDGRSLRAVKRRLGQRGAHLAPVIASGICIQALRGLHYAHELRDEAGRSLHLVHRDVSPENILVGFNGVVKLVDFGIAKAAVSISTTRNGALKGKLHYLAPELINGGKAGVRTDLYSMGVVLYEALTGRRPFTGSTDNDLFASITGTNPVPPSELNPEVPEPLSRIVIRALAKDPRERYASGEDMACALEDFIESRGTKVNEAQVSAMMRELFAQDLAAQRETSNQTPSANRGAVLASVDVSVPRKSLSLTPPPVPRGEWVSEGDPTSPERERELELEVAPPPDTPVTSLRKMFEGRGSTRDVPEVPFIPSSVEIDLGLEEKDPFLSRPVSPTERCQLVLLNANLAGRIFALQRTPVFIGRAGNNDLVIDHPSISHARCMMFLSEDGRWAAIDLSSRGILVNGDRFDQATLMRGDILRLGEVELLFSSTEAPGTPPPVPEVPRALPPQRPALVRRPIQALKSIPAVPAGMVLVKELALESSYGGTFTVEPFWMDRTLVTNAAFAAFVEATGEPPPNHWMGGRFAPAEADHPVVGVSLDCARAYAAWKGRRLPTNLEWEAAARGPHQWRFPWGDLWDSARCQGPERGMGGTSPVGLLLNGASPAGCLDLLGNVWEWAELDELAAPPEPGMVWVFGGSYQHACTEAGKIARKSVSTDKDYLYLGFRCAMGAR